MFNYYKEHIFPYLMNKNIGKKEILDLRKEVLSSSYGKVLELGIGTGLNLPLYPDNVSEITAVDLYVRSIGNTEIKVNLYNESIESMSFDDNYFDTVVSTFSLCSVDNLDKAVKEIKRVLKPDGILILLEHGRASGRFHQFMQNIANPFFNIFACGCNVNRDYFEILRKYSFNVNKCEIIKAAIYPRSIAGYIYMGVASNEIV